MGTHYFSSRDFSRDPGRAKKAANDGPVFITNRDRPEHVLMTMAEYRRLAARKGSIVERLALPESAEIDFEPERAAIDLKDDALG
ncbi:type II toxin-antitoxin system Phd/YefM family antitoxin [Erythrobacter sp. MTPC3]|uniref:type II toxin-antitoxin system Phd/YefM family antitoxin n=1 Tax=Erythrobacter sp. MTPC3 TaxID=3056564 RepID=UPI0036F38B13